MSAQQIKYTRHITWTCGATGKLVSPDLAELESDIEFLKTRMCPNCQLKEGDITETELKIMLANAADELSEMLALELLHDFLENMKKAAKNN